MSQRRYDMRHEMLTQRAPFCIGAMAKNGTLSQHFVTHFVPPLGMSLLLLNFSIKGGRDFFLKGRHTLWMELF